MLVRYLTQHAAELAIDPDAIAVFAGPGKLKGKGLGYRDPGVPAARACAQNGDGDAAIPWLASIPPRFRPRS